MQEKHKNEVLNFLFIIFYYQEQVLIEKRFCCVLGLELDKIGFSFEQSIEVFVITDHFTLKVNVSKPSKKNTTNQNTCIGNVTAQVSWGKL